MMKTSKTIRLLLVLIILGIIIMLIFYISKANESSAKSTTPTTTQSAEFMYTVKEYNGKIAVFEGNSTAPKEIYDTYVSTLPGPDREFLKVGIKVNSSQELEIIIEDLTS